MRVTAAVTSVSWIPSEAVEGLTRLPFQIGVGHYDDPPPESIESLEQLHAAGAFRFANELRAWADIEDGRILDYGHVGRGWISSTVLRLGPVQVRFEPTAFPDLRSIPEISETSVRFQQTTGGRPGVPAPRVVKDKPYVRMIGPIVWTTLSLTIDGDGSSRGEVVGASPFPRHWIYDGAGDLVAKSGLADFHEWYATSLATSSPWGEEDAPVLVTMAETALERRLATTIMRGGARPSLKRLPAGRLLAEQGQPGDELYLVLDGVLEVEVDGTKVAEVGPGAVLGERAILEGGRRSATVRAATEVRVAVAAKEHIDQAALAELAAGHRREPPPAS